MILANERHLGGLLRTTTYCGASLVRILCYCVIVKIIIALMINVIIGQQTLRRHVRRGLL